ncbi:hypothetical protein CSC70_02775 [Pseudoxanthomonas kalamensis DSM 18571]|uniref:DUF2782 domain-containing protein n=1 Tax=Pseudoxanthomonas kalamensis TaxID=289483 RepID=UPI001391D121|nr:DUF2782 domain-containing protein [Pseudoxanthomonas kalamensis]KAF1712459.1 hypothetical protein CSC70_02775 [Pseudoxanthomonas kalamensis DSM 18571]
MTVRLLLSALLLALAGCATTAPDPVPDLTGADVAVRTADNGDVIEEYRVGGLLRMVKITPLRGPAYYLYDRNGDGKLDNENKQMPMTYWKLFGW